MSTALVEEASGVKVDNSFSEGNIRRAFMKKVYCIVFVQLAITTASIAVFLFVPTVKQYTQQHIALPIGAMVMTFVLVIVLVCFDSVRRNYPTNLICLFLFTICEGFLCGAAASFYDVESVLIAAGICTVVCLALTLFAFQTKIDFTVCTGVLFVLLVIMLVFGIVVIFIPGRILNVVYASLGAVLFSVMLVYDTQLMMGGSHKYSLSPEEYVFAALNIYLDIINLFMYILQIIGGAGN